MTESLNSITLPVSLGEALDKLTILDIKMGKIQDDRKKDVKKEYSILYEKLEIHINKFKFYYRILKEINLSIWEMQDDFRYNDNDDDKKKLCMKIIDDNDRRFRVKKKINNLMQSSLKEQKGYHPKKAFVLTHLGLGDNITAIGMVRYLSTCYDEVIVVCKENNRKNIELFYEDDDSIKILAVENDRNISPRYGYNLDLFKEMTKDYTVYACGFHNLQGKKWGSIPFSFYTQLDLDHQHFWNYFHINKLDISVELYEGLKGMDYAFIHNTSSNGQVYSIDFVEDKLKLNKNELLFINPNINCYDETHKYYELAKSFIGHRLPAYTSIIENAKYNIFSDSSFMCMAINLEIKNDNNFYVSRSKHSYPLYEPEYKFKNVNRKIFQHLV